MNLPSHIEQLVRQARLFSTMDERQLAELLGSVRLLELQEGERLFSLGQTAERFFMVTKGRVKIFRVSQAGNEKIIEIFGPGDLFAEAVMFFEHRHYPVNAEALESSEICAFDSQTFLNLLRSSNELCLRMLGDLSMRLHGCVHEIDYLTLQNSTFRVVNYLVAQLPPSASHKATIDLSAPKNVIASRVSIKPETFSRILHNLAHEGIIGIQGKTIQVHDIERLRRFGQ